MNTQNEFEQLQAIAVILRSKSEELHDIKFHSCALDLNLLAEALVAVAARLRRLGK